MGIQWSNVKKEETRDGSRMCHQCQRNDKCRVVYCSNCERKRYCTPCINTWYVCSLHVVNMVYLCGKIRFGSRLYLQNCLLRSCRYPLLSEADIARECPYCKGNCNCKACLRLNLPERVSSLQHLSSQVRVISFVLNAKC